MDIKQTRKNRLIELAARFKKQKDMAIALGREPNYINQLLKGHRRIGEDVAREFEKKLNLPAYWMDGVESTSLIANDYPRLMADQDTQHQRHPDQAEEINAQYTLIAKTENEKAALYIIRSLPHEAQTIWLADGYKMVQIANGTNKKAD